MSSSDTRDMLEEVEETSESQSHSGTSRRKSTTYAQVAQSGANGIDYVDGVQYSLTRHRVCRPRVNLVSVNDYIITNDDRIFQVAETVKMPVVQPGYDVNEFRQQDVKVWELEVLKLPTSLRGYTTYTVKAQQVKIKIGDIARFADVYEPVGYSVQEKGLILSPQARQQLCCSKRIYQFIPISHRKVLSNIYQAQIDGNDVKLAIARSIVTNNSQIFGKVCVQKKNIDLSERVLQTLRDLVLGTLQLKFADQKLFIDQSTRYSVQKATSLFRYWLKGQDVEAMAARYDTIYKELSSDDKDFYDPVFKCKITNILDPRYLLELVIIKQDVYPDYVYISRVVKKLREMFGGQISNAVLVEQIRYAMVYRNQEYMNYLVYTHCKNNFRQFGYLAGIAMNNRLQPKDIKESITESKLYGPVFSPLIFAYYNGSIAFLEKSQECLSEDKINEQTASYISLACGCNKQDKINVIQHAEKTLQDSFDYVVAFQAALVSNNRNILIYLKNSGHSLLYAKNQSMEVLECTSVETFQNYLNHYSSTGNILNAEFITQFTTLLGDDDMAYFLAKYNTRPFNMYGDDALESMGILVKAYFVKSLNTIIDYGYNFRNINAEFADCICMQCDMQYVSSLFGILRKYLMNQRQEEKDLFKYLLTRLYFWGIMYYNEDKLKMFTEINANIVDAQFLNQNVSILTKLMAYQAYYNVYRFDLHQMYLLANKYGSVKILNKFADMDVNFSNYSGVNYESISTDTHELIGNISFGYQWHLDYVTRYLATLDYTSGHQPPNKEQILVAFCKRALEFKQNAYKQLLKQNQSAYTTVLNKVIDGEINLESCDIKYLKLYYYQINYIIDYLLRNKSVMISNKYDNMSVQVYFAKYFYLLTNEQPYLVMDNIDKQLVMQQRRYESKSDKNTIYDKINYKLEYFDDKTTNYFSDLAKKDHVYNDCYQNIFHFFGLKFSMDLSVLNYSIDAAGDYHKLTKEDINHKIESLMGLLLNRGNKTSLEQYNPANNEYAIYNVLAQFINIIQVRPLLYYTLIIHIKDCELATPVLGVAIRQVILNMPKADTVIRTLQSNFTAKDLAECLVLYDPKSMNNLLHELYYQKEPTEQSAEKVRDIIGFLYRIDIFETLIMQRNRQEDTPVFTMVRGYAQFNFWNYYLFKNQYDVLSNNEETIMHIVLSLNRLNVPVGFEDALSQIYQYIDISKQLNQVNKYGKSPMHFVKQLSLMEYIVEHYHPDLALLNTKTSLIYDDLNFNACYYYIQHGVDPMVIPETAVKKKEYIPYLRNSFSALYTQYKKYNYLYYLFVYLTSNFKTTIADIIINILLIERSPYAILQQLTKYTGYLYFDVKLIQAYAYFVVKHQPALQHNNIVDASIVYIFELLIKSEDNIKKLDKSIFYFIMIENVALKPLHMTVYANIGIMKFVPDEILARYCSNNKLSNDMADGMSKEQLLVALKSIVQHQYYKGNQEYEFTKKITYYIISEKLGGQALTADIIYCMYNQLVNCKPASQYKKYLQELLEKYLSDNATLQKSLQAFVKQSEFVFYQNDTVVNAFNKKYELTPRYLKLADTEVCDMTATYRDLEIVYLLEEAHKQTMVQIKDTCYSYDKQTKVLYYNGHPMSVIGYWSPDAERYRVGLYMIQARYVDEHSFKVVSRHENTKTTRFHTVAVEKFQLLNHLFSREYARFRTRELTDPYSTMKEFKAQLNKRGTQTFEQIVDEYTSLNTHVSPRGFTFYLYDPTRDTLCNMVTRIIWNVLQLRDGNIQHSVSRSIKEIKGILFYGAVREKIAQLEQLSDTQLENLLTLINMGDGCMGLLVSRQSRENLLFMARMQVSTTIVTIRHLSYFYFNKQTKDKMGIRAYFEKVLGFAFNDEGWVVRSYYPAMPKENYMRFIVQLSRRETDLTTPGIFRLVFYPKDHYEDNLQTYSNTKLLGYNTNYYFSVMEDNTVVRVSGYNNMWYTLVHQEYGLEKHPLLIREDNNE